jgi:hypothetical protein
MTMRTFCFIGLSMLMPCLAQDTPKFKGTTIPVPPEHSQPIPQIQVTRTWGDLLKTETITVEGAGGMDSNFDQGVPGKSRPTNVWVGIDRDHITSNGAVLLYCAAKSVSFAPPLILWNLGPLAVRVEWPGAPGNSLLPAEYNPAQGGYYQSHFVANGSNYVLFVQSIQLGKAATYPVRLFLPVKMGPNAKRILLAETSVVATGDPPEPWTPWGEVGASGNNNDPDNGDNDVKRAPSNISKTMLNPRGGVAIPGAPLGATVLPEAPAPTTPLPHLLPGLSDPPIRLTRDGNTFIAVLNQDQFFLSYPEDFFLTRWWVNDKPWVPDPSVREPVMRMEATQGVLLNEVHFVLDFRPNRFGAKKGDKIGIQLLYCPSGWQTGDMPSLSSDYSLANAKGALSLSPSFSFISNRVDFVY